MPFAVDASTRLQLGNPTALFTIDFDFNDPVFTNEVPLFAGHGSTYIERVNVIGYDVASSENTDSNIEQIRGLVLLNASLGSDYRYDVPRDTSTSFRLGCLY